jgi:hypothetical protein
VAAVERCSPIAVTSGYAPVSPIVVSAAAATPAAAAGPLVPVRPRPSAEAPADETPSPPGADALPNEPGEPIMIDPEQELKGKPSSVGETIHVDRTTRLVPVVPRRHAQVSIVRRQARF